MYFIKYVLYFVGHIFENKYLKFGIYNKQNKQYVEYYDYFNSIYLIFLYLLKLIQKKIYLLPIRNYIICDSEEGDLLTIGIYYVNKKLLYTINEQIYASNKDDNILYAYVRTKEKVYDFTYEFNLLKTSIINNTKYNVEDLITIITKFFNKNLDLKKDYSLYFMTEKSLNEQILNKNEELIYT